MIRHPWIVLSYWWVNHKHISFWITTFLLHIWVCSLDIIIWYRAVGMCVPWGKAQSKGCLLSSVGKGINLLLTDPPSMTEVMTILQGRFIWSLFVSEYNMRRKYLQNAVQWFRNYHMELRNFVNGLSQWSENPYIFEIWMNVLTALTTFLNLSC